MWFQAREFDMVDMKKSQEKECCTILRLNKEKFLITSYNNVCGVKHGGRLCADDGSPKT